MREAAIILAALAAIACSKTSTTVETPAAPGTGALKFEISVADIDGTDGTKAPRKVGRKAISSTSGSTTGEGTAAITPA